MPIANIAVLQQTGGVKEYALGKSKGKVKIWYSSSWRNISSKGVMDDAKNKFHFTWTDSDQ